MSLTSILLRLGSVWKDLADAEAAGNAAFDYLISEYSLPSRGCGKPSGRYGHFTSLDNAWRERVLSLVRLVVAAPQLNDVTHKACGDIAMFVLVFSHTHVDNTDDQRRVFLVDQALLNLESSETQKSLVALGRGLGGDYALRIVSKELRERFSFAF